MSTMHSRLIAAAIMALAVAGCGGTGGEQAISKGDDTTVDGLTYKVVETNRSRRIAIPDGVTYTAENGVYLTVELALENRTRGAARALGESIALRGGDGKQYAIDEDGSAAYHLTLGPHRHDPKLFEPTRPDPIFAFYDVAPGTTRAASVTFDVPEKALEDSRLEVRAWKGAPTFLELGL